MELLKAIGFVKRGKNRKKVFMNLDKPMIPSELVMRIYKSNSNTYFNLVSRALSELKEKNLVEIVNPEDRTGRIYKRTKKGEKVYKRLKE
ncbi:MAG: MarR family transcriptional regulator [Nanoarchaeota archaeon]|nr:MarR family transcriptional regulator [Nanoarchaeota archaeon]